MCLDLQYSPVRAVELYCARTRIEIMFDVLKHLIGAFCFRFWSKRMPKHSRRPVSNRYLKKPQPEHLASIEACWQAYERFVLCAMIAQGLLQLVKHVLTVLFNQQLFNVQQNGIIQKIRAQFVAMSDDDDDG